METRYISLDDAVQCAEDVAVDFENDDFTEMSMGAHTVGEWLKDIPAAYVVPAPRWIPVEERQPELTEQAEGNDFLLYYSKPVLVRRFGRYTEIAAFALEGLAEFWVDETLNKISGVTHWMPLPQPPKEGGGTL